MQNVRFHPDPFDRGSSGRARFNVLLTEERWHGPDHWSRVLPRWMAPLGVVSYKVSCGQEALDVVQQVPIHAAVVDVATPRLAVRAPLSEADDAADGASESTPDASSPAAIPGGLWLLELFQRLPNKPPVVIVRSKTITSQDASRLLREALRLGAFTVVEDPRLEHLLSVFQRLFDRLYHGQWPE